eukprot:CAMPEP_0168525358 /NCGR_PEP_ID=MMETSP0405-20121227/11248_1 /TAXON_ID=498012 /ORGANISM="Trichosphaerium sp, Strain Am-I-7 wt" /LENGTH=290 /DNA_ID=CAMNT_0008547841 /DNA_START=44 /DNA_END=916 /DNA_ORIENTATION=+
MSEILDDLCCRFVINCPEEEWAFERICFQIEQAHWFYEDFYRENDDKLPQMNLRVFSEKIFAHCPLLHLYGDQFEQIFDVFKNYKMRVPVYGAIILNATLDKCLLVQGWGQRSSWGFPRGKVNKDEDGLLCAIREVYEEIGFDLKGHVSEKDHLKLFRNEQECKLYIAPFIPEDTFFEPQTRKEIGAIQWVKVSDLPSQQSKNGKDRSKYFLVLPFVKKLRQWIKRKKRAMANDNDAAVQEVDDDHIVEDVEEEIDTEPIDVIQHDQRYIPSLANFKFDRTAIMECFNNL